MDTLHQLFNLIFHVDQALEGFIAAHGNGIYAFLFLVIFVETGLVVMPFLPGDSLLFIVGAFCAKVSATTHLPTLDYALSCSVLLVAAVAGDHPQLHQPLAGRRGAGAELEAGEIEVPEQEEAQQPDDADDLRRLGLGRPQGRGGQQGKDQQQAHDDEEIEDQGAGPGRRLAQA